MRSGLLTVGRMVVAVLAYQVVLIGSTILLFVFGLRGVSSPAQGTFGLIGLGMAEGLALLAVVLVWRYVDRRPVRALGLARRNALRKWLRGAAVALLMMGFVVLVWYTLLDGATWGVNPSLAQAAIALIGGFLGYLVQGPAEEILFRGHLLENMRREWGLAWAVGVTSLAFGLFHAANPGFGLLPFVNLVLFGVATALYKMRIDNGQLWGVFAIHSIWNWLQQVVFGLPNSGIATAPENTLFTVSPNPTLPDPIWGGGFGPEGTLGTTLVLLAVIGVCLRRQTSVSPRR